MKKTILHQLCGFCVVLFATSPLLQAQPSLVAGSLSSGQIPLTLQTNNGRMYRWETSSDLTSWTNLPPLLSSQRPLLGDGNPMALNIPVSQTKEFFRVKETAPFEPPWSAIKPLRVISLAYISSSSILVNGDRLRTAMLALAPGDRLEIAPGTYSISTYTNLSLAGTAQSPIWITAPLGGVTITRPDATQNLLNIGTSSPTRYLSFDGIKFTGGSVGLKLLDCSNIWINRCTLQNFDSSAVTAISANTSYLYITRNEISNTLNDGDGICIGDNSGSVISSNCVFALNHIHHTSGIFGGEGIDIKPGSWGNLVSGNIIHDINTVAIFVGSGNPSGLNIVENNICYATADTAFMANSHCQIRNNLVFGGTVGAFGSQIMSGISPTNISVLHNTFISSGGGVAARLSSWNTGSNQVFANNACYSQTGYAIYAPSGTGTAQFAGLVTYGSVTAGIPIASNGTGLGDFISVTWDGTFRNATPSTSSPLKNAALSTYRTEYDLYYYLRTLSSSTGSVR